MQFRDEAHLRRQVLFDLRQLYGSRWNTKCLLEQQCGESQSRVDIFIQPIGLYIELKGDAEATSMDRAMGQALRYAIIDMRTTWIVLPDDVSVGEHYFDVAHSMGAKIVRYSALIPMLRDALEQDVPGVAVEYHKRLLDEDYSRAVQLRGIAPTPAQIAELQYDRLMEYRARVERVKAAEGCKWEHGIKAKRFRIFNPN